MIQMDLKKQIHLIKGIIKVLIQFQFSIKDREYHDKKYMKMLWLKGQGRGSNRTQI